MKKILCYLIISISLFISCGSQNISKSNINNNFTEQFFTNQNVYRILKKYVQDDKVNIIDPDHNITNEFLIFKNNDLTININTQRKSEYDFFIKKVIINKNLAFIVLWYKDTTTALCFYPIKSERTPNKWIIEEITTRSIK
ncbi:hypothetical protein A0O34_01170 [Chryseobacterium glaciei]|uniref:DUF4348 domain-containing protein n=1 Tax=Chryseobacterium glaciei TaxID=1685010 RepID=A0A172XQZ6_9FLAO|nr:hypothetical protein [Chryseobacterium glaciei]ANF49252.1 hypothetical protein A0O34_01170 [Chryseobacterium glaciei]